MLFVNRGGLIVSLDENDNNVKKKVLDGEFREANEQEIAIHNKSLHAAPVAPTESKNIKKTLQAERAKAQAVEQKADQTATVKALKKPTKKRKN